MFSMPFGSPPVALTDTLFILTIVPLAGLGSFAQSFRPIAPPWADVWSVTRGACEDITTSDDQHQLQTDIAEHAATEIEDCPPAKLAVRLDAERYRSQFLIP